MNSYPHPDNELLRLLDADLSPAEEQSLERHLSECSACQRRLEELRQTSGTYLEFHESVLKPSLPSPPRPWQLDFQRVAPAPARPARRIFFGFRGALTAAAVIASIIVVAEWFGRTPAVKAAELLRRAVAAEDSAPPEARARAIRIQTLRYKFERPARVDAARQAPESSAEAAKIRQLFQSSGYDWDDPLSAASYLRWRDKVRNKRDDVRIVANRGAGESYVIRTTTTDNPITDASLTLRAEDLRAVSCNLRFGGGELVNVTTAPEDEKGTPASSTTLPPPPQASTVASPARSASAGEELQVIAELHRLGADLGEQIEVKREAGSVSVIGTGLEPQRQRDLTAALAGIPAVHLQFGATQTKETARVERRPTPLADAANPLLAELEALRPNVPPAELAEQVADNTERVMERIYALRSLARRFPPAAAAQLSAEEKGTLNGIVNDHAQAAALFTARLKELIAPLLSPASRTHAAGGWQEIAEAIQTDIKILDQALNTTASTEQPAERKLRASGALANIEEGAAQIRALVQ